MTDTTKEVRRLYKELSDEFGRPPTSVEIAEQVGVSSARVRQIMAKEGLSTYSAPANRALEQEIDPHASPIQRRIALNLRALYRKELAKKKPRTDKQIAIDSGWISDDPSRDAVNMRRYYCADRNAGLGVLEKLAQGFGVDVSELLAPVKDDAADA